MKNIYILAILTLSFLLSCSLNDQTPVIENDPTQTGGITLLSSEKLDLNLPIFEDENNLRTEAARAWSEADLN